MGQVVRRIGYSLLIDFLSDCLTWGGGGGGHSSRFYKGRLSPEVQPLALLYTILTEKVHLSLSFITDRIMNILSKRKSGKA